MSKKKAKKVYELDYGSLATGLLDDNAREYIVQISKYETLSNDEQLELLRQYREEGNKESYQKLIHHNLKLAVYIIKKYNGNCRTMSFLDLIQEANITIMAAIDLFDPSIGTNLSTYISDSIKKGVQRRIDLEDRIIHEPVQLRLLVRNYARFFRDFHEKNQRQPTEEEVMEALDINEDKIKKIKNSLLLDPTSLNKELEGTCDNPSELQDFIVYEDPNFEKVEDNFDTKLLLIAAKEMLTKKEYYIIYHRHVVPKKRRLVQIGAEFDVTREAIRQSEKKALKKLKRIKQHKDKIIEKYTMKEIEQEKVIPLTPRELSYYGYLKEKLDWLTYYFIYTKREKNYNYYDYKRELKDLSEQELRECMTFCFELEEEIFTEERIKTVFEKLKTKRPISKLFALNIEPEKEKITKEVKEELKETIKTLKK